jgi:hypothetical protein
VGRLFHSIRGTRSRLVVPTAPTRACEIAEARRTLHDVYRRLGETERAADYGPERGEG